MTRLSPSAVAGIAHDAVAQLASAERPAPQSPIPVEAATWKRVIEDAGGLATTRLHELGSAALDAVVQGDGAALRRASARFASEAVDLADRTASVGVFAPGGSDSARTFATAVVAGTGAALAALPTATASDIASLLRPVDDARAALVRSTEGIVESALGEALGLRPEELYDARGRFSTSRVLARFYGRYGDLAERIAQLLAPFTVAPPWPLHSLPAIEALTSRRAFVTAHALRLVRREIAAACTRDLDRAAGVLLDHAFGVDESAENHEATIRSLAALADAGAREAAVTMLDVYRRVVEGQLRPWLWTVLRLRGAARRTTPPMLAELRDRLRAGGDSLGAWLAGAVDVDARNAAAHERYRWDDAAQMLAIGSRHVPTAELESLVGWITAFVAGAEAAVAIARTESQVLAASMEARQEGRQASLTIREIDARASFGTNGLSVTSQTHEGAAFTVVLDDLPHRLINPCFQAVVEAALRLPLTQRFTVVVAATPVIDVDREVIERCADVWRAAVHAYWRDGIDSMPMTTFLPINVASRLAVETSKEGANAAAWFAIDDAIAAFEDAGSLPSAGRAKLARLVARLDIAVLGLEACKPQIPVEAVARLALAQDILTTALRWATAASSGFYIALPGEPMLDRLWGIYNAWSPPALLPTVDARPITEVERTL